MGLMAAKVPQRQHLAAAAVLEENGGAPAPLHQGGQQSSIAAEGRVFPTLGAEARARSRPTGQRPGQGAAPQGQGGGEGKGQSRRPHGGAVQSSKRELLSRGPGVEEALPGRLSLSLRRTGVKEASLTSGAAEAPGAASVRDR